MKVEAKQFMVWLIVLWGCLLGAGCTSSVSPAPADSKELKELKASLSGFRQDTNEAASGVQETLKENTDVLREIRDAMQQPSGAPQEQAHEAPPVEAPPEQSP